ncbi:MAG: TadE/TadG family type IV pilus assembly protein [Candidatus Bathyarchaeia archaeon]
MNRGQAAVELAVVLIVLLLLIIGGFELARFITLKHSLSAGTWHAARYLSLNPWDEEKAREIILQTVERNVLGSSKDVEIYIYFEDPLNKKFGSRFSILAEIPFDPFIPFLPITPRKISVSHSLMVEAWP